MPQKFRSGNDHCVEYGAPTDPVGFHMRSLQLTIFHGFATIFCAFVLVERICPEHR